MSDEDPQNVPPPYPGQVPPEQPHQPNWGSAYPPPGQGQQGQYPPPGYGQQPPPGYYPPGYGYHPFAPQPPRHPNATLAMVLGIVGLGGGFMCGLPLLAAPFAWFTGSKAVRDIDASNGTVSGRSEANAGKILGIVGTVLLTLVIAGIVLLIVLTLTVDDFWDDDYDSYDEAVRGALAMLRR